MKISIVELMNNSKFYDNCREAFVKNYQATIEKTLVDLVEFPIEIVDKGNFNGTTLNNTAMRAKVSGTNAYIEMFYSAEVLLAIVNSYGLDTNINDNIELITNNSELDKLTLNDYYDLNDYIDDEIDVDDLYNNYIDNSNIDYDNIAKQFYNIINENHYSICDYVNIDFKVAKEELSDKDKEFIKTLDSMYENLLKITNVNRTLDSQNVTIKFTDDTYTLNDIKNFASLI